MTTIEAAKPWEVDNGILPMPWNRAAIEEVSKRPLRIAVLAHDGRVRPHPPLEKAIRETAEKLRRAGHDGPSFCSL